MILGGLHGPWGQGALGAVLEGVKLKFYQIKKNVLTNVVKYASGVTKKPLELTPGVPEHSEWPQGEKLTSNKYLRIDFGLFVTW